MDTPLRFERDPSATIIDAARKFHMPQVKCDVCRRTWGEWNIDYPAFDLPLFAKDKRFTTNSVIGVEEMKSLRAEILRLLGQNIYLPPGCGLGPQEGEAGHPLPDFVGAGAAPFIRVEALKQLQADGFELIAGDASLKRRGKKVATHVPLHIYAVPLVTAESCKTNEYEHCERCGIFYAKRIVPTAQRNLMFDPNLIPKGIPLIKDGVSCATLASAEFVKAVECHGFTGAKFFSWGKFAS